MSLIEELPVTGPTRVSHGWAYVPDTGPIPAMAPAGSRKRNRNDTGTTNATATAKQQTAVQQRLESLDKENYKENVTVAIPARTGTEIRESKSGKKTTSNVRRILTYQRIFQHYLADEEAGMNGSAPSAQAPVLNPQRTDFKRKSAVRTETPPGRPNGRSRRKEGEADTRKDRSSSAGTMRPPGRPRKSLQEDTQMSDTSANIPVPKSPHKSTPAVSTPDLACTSNTKSSYDPKLDTHPLLRTLTVPRMPSARVMAALVAEAPLSYTTARANPLPVPEDDTPKNTILTAKPPRHFCALCGYWGKVKCRKCGEWTCGLMECWRGHEGVCIAMGMY